jgi:hypothetical protein
VTSLRRKWSLLSPLAVAAIATGCSDRASRVDPAASSDASAGAPSPSDPPSPSRAGEGSAHRIADRQEVPLQGPRVDARAGDWLLENEGRAAVVDTRGGRIVDFGSTGGDDALVAIEPAVYLGLDDLRSEVVSVAAVSGAPGVVRIERVVHDVPLRLWTFVSFTGTALRIESVATSAGAAAPPVTIGEKVSWGNVPTWVQGSGFIVRGGSFSGDFIAREGLGEAYALGRPNGRLVARFDAPSAGFHERAHTGEGLSAVPAGGASSRRVLLLAHAKGAIGDAVVELLRAEGVPVDRATMPAVPAGPRARRSRVSGSARRRSKRRCREAASACEPLRPATRRARGCRRPTATAALSMSNLAQAGCAGT